MNIFLSYPSARRDFAERLKLALEAEQHEVFFDRDDLPAGEAFHQAIRQAVQAADLFIFVVAPESLHEGSYARAELALAQERWPQPGGHVLPVLLAPVDKALLPPYLLAVTLLEPPGDAVAATLAAVARLNRSPLRRWALKAAVGAALLGLLAASWWVQQQRQHAAAVLVRRVGEALAVAKLCTEGDPAVPFAQLSALAEAPDAPAAVKQAQEDCAMHWLRLARPGPDRTFAQFTEPLKPVLVRALVRSQALGPQGAGAVNGARAADLRAHLGWADALRWQDLHDPGIDPTGLYREALLQDPGNAYAHGMWGSWLLLKRPMQVYEALKHFDAAVAARRDLPFIRRLQLGAMLGTDELGLPLVQLLNQMRLQQEPLPETARQRAWSYHYAHAWRDEVRVNVLKALPPVEGLATFDWLFPAPETSDSRHASWVLLRARLQLQLGLTDAARTALQAVQRQMRASRDSGPIVDAVNRQLTRLQ